MRVAFVVGFFEEVRKCIEATLSAALCAGSIVWVKQAPGKPYPDLGSFNSLFFDKLAQGASEILVLVAIVRGRDKEWLEPKISAFEEEGKKRFGARIIVHYERDARNANFVLGKLREFAPTVPTLITSQQIREKLGGKKVLCVREKQNTGFRSALERAGFESAVYDEHFIEYAVKAGTKPDSLREKVKYHQHVMYAFDGFGHSFGTFLNGHECVKFKEAGASACVASFKKWLLGGSSN